jgi:C4-dicarboxylate-specific signal transduction histidine kinase
LLLRTILLAYALFALLLTSLQLYDGYETLRESAAAELRRVEVTFYPGLQNAIWQLDPEQIVASVEGMLRFPSVVGVAVQAPGGEALIRRGVINAALAQSPLSSILGNVAQTTAQFQQEMTVHQFTLTDLYDPERAIAEVYLFTSHDVVMEAFQRDLAGTLLVAIVQTLILSALFAFFIRRLVVKPLQQLHQRAEFLSRCSSQELSSVAPLAQQVACDSRELCALRDSLDELRQARLADERQKSELQSTNTELRQTQQQLVQSTKMAAMGEMLAMIAHQWRQPLGTIAAIVGNLSIKTKLKTTDADHTLAELQKITTQTTFLSTTISDFRDFFQPDKERSVVQLTDLWRQTSRLTENSLRSHGVTVIEELEDVPPLALYANELQQVLLNLIKNAQDALDERAIANKQVLIRVSATSAAQRISVQDNAGGIPEDILSRIFEPYFSTKGKLNGTGLGLYMSKMIVEEHLEGSLSVQNLREGACFTIELPCAEVEAAPRTETSERRAVKPT